MIRPQHDHDPQGPAAVLWWHFHQPDYREPADEGEETTWAHFPWVRMHATRGYTDLVAQAIDFGPQGMTFNMVPSLADQLDDLASGKVLDRHYTLALHLAEHSADDATEQEAFLRHASPTPRPIAPLPRFDVLRGLAAEGHVANRQDALDACVLFHLAWFGFVAFRSDDIVALAERGQDFSEGDLLHVLEISKKMAAEVLPRLAHGQKIGALFLTTTPNTHPILPLLIDTRCAHEATSDGGAPAPWGRPDDADRQVEDAIKRHQQCFGVKPKAMWPAEGSLSEAAAACLVKAGIEVAASDEELLRKSLHQSQHQAPHRSQDAGSLDVLLEPAPLEAVPLEEAHFWPWQHEKTGLKLLFRDRRLSDDWGFVYRNLAPSDAARTFVDGAVKKANAGSVVSVILDGENPFEHYPHAGRDHLAALAREAYGRLRFISPEEAVTKNPRPLPHLATGSWINANFDIWAGDEEDRRGWALLQAVRDAIDLDTLDDKARKRAEDHLFAAEGSDWFWWFGPEFSIPDKAGFDAVFRRHLRAAALAAGIALETLPDLEQPVAIPKRPEPARRPLPIGVPDGGAKLGSWANALVFGGDSDGGSMHRGAPLLSEVRIMGNLEHLFMRAEVRDDVTAIELVLEGPDGQVSARVDRTERRDVFEADCRWTRAGIEPGNAAAVRVTARASAQQGDHFESAPARGAVTIHRPGANWFEA